MTSHTNPQNDSSKAVLQSVWMIVGCAFCFGILSRLVSLSFNLDGAVYASLARNLAEGVGSMWALKFSDSMFPVFSEHPPLMFWLLSVCFRFFGDSIAVEKAFSLVTFALSVMLFWQIWIKLNRDDSSVLGAFPFALFFLLIAGRLTWGFANGLLENLLCVFSLATILLMILAYQDLNHKLMDFKRLALIMLAGCLICLSLLTKGLVGLFPLATPFIYWLAFRKPRWWIILMDVCVLILVILGFVYLLHAFADSRDAMNRYLESQLLPSLRGDRGSFGGRLNVIRKIIGINGYAIIIISIFFYLARKFAWKLKAADTPFSRNQRTFFLLMIALSSSLPLGLSPRVTNFYFNPSVFFYASGLAVWGAPAMLAGCSKLSQKMVSWFRNTSLFVLTISIIFVFWNIGEPGEEAQAIRHVTTIKQFVCADGSNCKPNISACDSVWVDWTLQAFLQRWYKISLARADNQDAVFLIADENCRSIPGFTDTKLDISPYFLLKKNEPSHEKK